MKKSSFGARHLLTVLCSLYSMALISPTRAAMVSESFNTAVSAAANGWAGSLNVGGGSNYGFSNTSNAGGTAGEAGGVFARVGADSYYADLTLGGTFSRTMDFSATGKFDMTATGSSPNTAFFLGFLNPTPGVTNGFVGIAFIDESTGSKFKFAPTIRFSDGTEVAGTPITVVSGGLGVDRTFSLTWDADGGATNDGRLTVTLSGLGGGAISVDVGNAHDARNFGLSAFGLSQRALSSPSASASITLTGYMDDVTYSVIPEPTGCVTMFFVLVWMLACGRRMR